MRWLKHYIFSLVGFNLLGKKAGEKRRQTHRRKERERKIRRKSERKKMFYMRTIEDKK